MRLDPSSMRLRGGVILGVLVSWAAADGALCADEVEREGVRGDAARSESATAADESATHWAYRPIVRPAVPDIEQNGWVRGPIDSFILSRLEQHEIEPAAEADRRTLLRRATYDLTGLPPTPREVEAFLADRAPGAYERLVDRLLASPAYGEKWGRHWLDLVRYAETNGYERDGVKANAWRYRDYVIQSLNAGKPFDRFVLEQLAGDELEDRSAESIIATGYYRLGLWDDEPVDADQAFFDSLDDVVSTTSQVFLGMTLGCARCHDHKIDPILQRDYYSFLSFFRNTYEDIRQLEFKKSAFTHNTQTVIASEAERREHERLRKELKQQVEALENQIRQAEERVVASLTAPEREDAADAEVRKHLIEKKAADILNTDERDAYNAAKSKLEQLKKSKLPPLPHALSIKENGPEVADTFVLVRGNVHAPGDKVVPDFPSVLNAPEPVLVEPADDASSSGRRTVLARWLVDSANPATSRVLANRLWQHHFGRGLVPSANDFGNAGEEPTHPDLLDWLATECVRQEWRLKTLHRMIMTSSAYRMSSHVSEKALRADPDNRLLSRFSMRRLTAEEVRDTILSVGGVLTTRFGGPSVYTELPAEVLASASRPDAAWGKSAPDEQSRRSVYVHVKRSLAEPMLKTFDSPDTEGSCAVRFVTTVPTQSLTMLNGEFFGGQAATFAERLMSEAGGEPTDQVELAFRLALSRAPRLEEKRTALDLLEQWQRDDGLAQRKALEYFCLMVWNLNEFVYLD